MTTTTTTTTTTSCYRLDVFSTNLFFCFLFIVLRKKSSFDFYSFRPRFIVVIMPHKLVSERE